jgi:SOS-response transcriptional repressor LexA
LSTKRTDVLRRVCLPFVGIVSAGYPLNNDQLNDWCTVRLPRDARERDYFVVRVDGESLTGVNIEHGDYVVCRRTREARNGQLAAVLTPDGVTLKHIYFEPRGWVVLAPANPNFRALRFRADDVTVQGVVISIERD